MVLKISFEIGFENWIWKLVLKIVGGNGFEIWFWKSVLKSWCKSYDVIGRKNSLEIPIWKGGGDCVGKKCVEYSYKIYLENQW